MNRYAAAVFLFTALANGALLFGTGFLCGGEMRIWRWALGAVTMGAYATYSLLAGSWFINKILFRLLVMVLTGVLSFGSKTKTIAAYILLSFALEGVVNTAGNGNVWAAVPSALLLLCLSAIMIRKNNREKRFVPVELQFAGKQLKLIALRDTGNLLYDPITGTPVLILGLRASQELTGLSKFQLQRPVDVMREPPIPGLRLIPFKTISQSNGLVLGLQVSAVRVGNWNGHLIVALAPEEFSSRGEFDALTGGFL